MRHNRRKRGSTARLASGEAIPSPDRPAFAYGRRAVGGSGWRVTARGGKSSPHPNTGHLDRTEHRCRRDCPVFGGWRTIMGVHNSCRTYRFRRPGCQWSIRNHKGCALFSRVASAKRDRERWDIYRGLAVHRRRQGDMDLSRHRAGCKRCDTQTHSGAGNPDYWRRHGTDAPAFDHL